MPKFAVVPHGTRGRFSQSPKMNAFHRIFLVPTGRVLHGATPNGSHSYE
jgi:hypothetical protein